MSSLSIPARVKKNIFNFPGWKSKRKIVVFESDDWGSIRMPSKSTYHDFINHGFKLEQTKYNKFDCLESNDDLERLFEVLSKFKDVNGNPPVFTANCIVANPDFAKIRDSNFEDYHYECFTETLKQYPNSDNVLKLMIEANQHQLFHPQFHGREHLNIKRWMHDLQRKSENVLFTFSRNSTYSGNEDYNYMAAFDYSSNEDIQNLKGIITDGLEIFEKIFNYKSKSIIAPCYVWDKRIEPHLASKGVQYIQGGHFQLMPTNKFEEYNKRYRYTGKKNNSSQIYLVRNNSFEPILANKNNWIEYVMDSMDISFKHNKPSIISTHRINYIGSLVENNRTENLKLLKELLNRILVKYPEVEFMTSDELGDLIACTTNNKI
jgi:hypothetical protein